MTKESEHQSVLLVGGSGRLGKMFISHIETATVAPKITLQTRRSPLSLKFNSLHWDPLDGSESLLQWQQENGAFDSVIALAGVTPTSSQDLSMNIEIANSIVEAVKQARIPKILLASSSAVYGVGENLLENAALSPINAYGKAKRDMETKATKLAAGYTNLCLLRIGNVAGADALLQNTLSATSHEPIEIDQFADGRGPIRSYIGPATLTNALLTLASRKDTLPNVLNIGVTPPVDMIDLAHAARAPISMRSAQPNAIQNITLNCTKFETLVMLPKNAGDPNEMVTQWQNLRKNS